VPQVVERLPSKCNALSANPSTVTKKKKKKKKSHKWLPLGLAALGLEFSPISCSTSKAQRGAEMARGCTARQ
jgi:hypothetical protein